MWFRADLRCDDNTALHCAARDADDGVVAVFTICPDQWRAHDWAAKRVNLMLRQLHVVSESLDRINIPLRIVTVPSFTDVPEALAALADEVGAAALYFNKEYEVNEQARDDAVAARFAQR